MRLEILLPDTHERWRPIIAALANAHTRVAAARLLLGATVDEAVVDLPAAKRPRAREALIAAGMVDPTTRRFAADVFHRILAEHRVSPRDGADRFLRDGRITQVPASLGDRRDLLTHIASQTFSLGEALDEAAVNARLAAYTDDVAMLRRYLVDHGILQRRTDGSAYTIVSGATGAAE